MDSTPTPASEYPLGYTRYANCRLNLQNFLVNETFNQQLFDAHIQPSPFATSNLAIADVCCGTGHWLLSIQRHLHPRTSLHAFDITLSNLPPETWTPGISRHIYNIYDPPPAEFRERFDIVNISMVNMFVDDTQIETVISHVLGFVKPGGYLQWVECEACNVSVHSPGDQHAPAKFVRRLWPEFMGLVDKTPPNWAPSLAEVFAKPRSLDGDGSVDIVNVVRPQVDVAWLRAWNEHYYTGFEEILGAMTDVTGEKKRQADAYRELLRNAYREFKEDGACVWTPLIRVVVRKT